MCNDHMDAIEIFHSDCGLKMLEALQEDLKDTKEHIKLLENTLKYLSTPSQKLLGNSQTYNKPKECAKPKLNSDNFQLPLINHSEYLPLDCEPEMKEVGNPYKSFQSLVAAKKCTIHILHQNTASKTNCHEIKENEEYNSVNKGLSKSVSIVLLSDSHDRGIAEISRYQQDLNMTSVVEPGAGLQEILKDHKNRN
ncbi:uncharacterized protein LOC126175462 [Schistocerca cancellata]|uniref:uncharacterized protein LOC126175462 n=1 Tax=Schistocerca cancellata TaxID=274614 RepID=UPI00211818D8|nr:uncharacterized protein LOC126175462 [Schistocerca cancellata]